VTEGRNSPARSTAPEHHSGEGVAFLVREAAPKLKEALGTAYGERGGVRWLGTDGAAEGRGRCGDDGLLEADTARGADEMQRWPSFIVVYYVEATRVYARRERGS
jgi:hypothetical protein